MANIKYRISDSIANIPATTSVKFAPMSNIEIDGNFKSIQVDLDTKSPIASPTFTGIPRAPTAAPGTNTTQIATTAFVAAANSASAAAVTINTSNTNSAFKIPFANTTTSANGNYALLQDTTATFTYNPNTNTVSAGVFSGNFSGNITVTNDLSSTALHYPFMSTGTSEAQAVKVSSSKLSFRPSTGNLTAAGSVTAFSDIRLKTDLNQIEDALNKVNQLTGYTYTRTDTGAKQTGLIAQDLQKVLPEAVEEGEYLSIAYGNVVGLLVEAIKELKQEIDALKGTNK